MSGVRGRHAARNTPATFSNIVNIDVGPLAWPFEYRHSSTQASGPFEVSYGDTLRFWFRTPFHTVSSRPCNGTGVVAFASSGTGTVGNSFDVKVNSTNGEASHDTMRDSCCELGFMNDLKRLCLGFNPGTSSFIHCDFHCNFNMEAEISGVCVWHVLIYPYIFFVFN